MDRKRDVTSATSPKLVRILQIVVGGLVAFIVLILVLSVLGGRMVDEEKQEAPAEVASGPALVATADPAIRSVSVEGSDLRVGALINSAWTSADYAPQTGIIVEAIGNAVQEGAADAKGAEQLVLTVKAPSTDRLGRQSEVTIFTVFFSMKDLREAEFENLTNARTLNLATGISVATAGLEVMAEYCSSDRGRRESVAFCSVGAGGDPTN